MRGFHYDGIGWGWGHDGGGGGVGGDQGRKEEVRIGDALAGDVCLGEYLERLGPDQRLKPQ